jgi:hypothetical protein
MESQTQPGNSHLSSPYKETGAVLILIGLLLGLDQILKTGWLTFLIFPLCGVILIRLGLNLKKIGWLITGSLIFGLGAAGYFILGDLPLQPTLVRLAKALILFGGSWILIAPLTIVIHRKPAFWALIPGGVLIGLGIALAHSPVRILDFVLFVSCGLGLSLLIWGLASRLLGLIIPACLFISIGPGIYFSWRDLIDLNALAQTGAMLVWFAFGWGMISIMARRIYHKFIWWPLIPGGILAVTGWGLFIGGDPGNALGFIGNTGSVAMLVFGLYLLLMRKGIHR